MDASKIEGAKEMAAHLAKVLGGPYDRVNGDPKFIMGMESAAETCRRYADLSSPLEFAKDPLNPKWDEEQS